jgi:hypothetical protein
LPTAGFANGRLRQRQRRETRRFSGVGVGGASPLGDIRKRQDSESRQWIVDSEW